jgi:probable biosynthetic protein (TIGR04098 family)
MRLFAIPSDGSQVLRRLKLVARRISSSALRAYYRNVCGMDIGKGVSISLSAKMDLTNPKGVHIGDYTIFAFGSAILTHDFVNGIHKDTRIGSHCMIGAGAKIMPGMTIGDHCIVGPNSVVASDVPANTVVMGVPARIVEKGIVTGKWGIRAPEFLRHEGITKEVREAATKVPVASSEVYASPLDALLSYLPQLRADQLQEPFQQLAMDSFALVTLRAQIEETERITISDEDWTSISRPLDLRRWTRRGMTKQAERPDRLAAARRFYEINLPQMAMAGLSEGWLFREVGDVHWDVLTSALGVKSRDIADQAGERLYATFTRLRYRSKIPLGDIKIDSHLEFSSEMSRFGAGMFFSKTCITGDGAEILFDVATAFSRFGESNTKLIKSQPVLPEGFVIPSLGALPDFVDEYRRLRASDLGPVLFETEYEIIPQHDINGVGLLYFAAYPNISDICLMRHLGGAAAALEWSPLERDVCYFANANPTETLIYRLHSAHGCPEKDSIVFLGSISRKSDGKTMSRVEVKLQRRGAGRIQLPETIQAVLG